MKKNHFGKHRTYQCPRCQAVCFRDLHHKISPCRHCGYDLTKVPHTVSDSSVVARNRDYVGAVIG